MERRISSVAKLSESREGLQDSENQAVIYIHPSGMTFAYLFLVARVPGDLQRVPFVLSLSDLKRNGMVGCLV